MTKVRTSIKQWRKHHLNQNQVLLTSSPRSVARINFWRGTNKMSDISPVAQSELAMLEVLVGVEGTVTGGEMGMLAEERDEETVPPAVVVKGVMGIEVEDGGGAVVEETELLSGLG